MNYVKIKSSLVLFFMFIFGMCSPALSDVRYNVKVNNNDIELSVSDDGEFIVLNKTKNNILFKKENILSDGIYFLNNISKEKDLFVVRLVFGGSGGQELDYYYHIDENSVYLVKESTRYLETESSIRDRVCDYFYSNKVNECFYLVLMKSYLYDLNRKKTSMYLIKGDRVKIIKTAFDADGTRWYFINYKGKKEINMWIKADSVDLN
ncbi:hypothetical protein [Aggregatibacter aphrophilus]|uniref:hypothetical protein n=1 Tax=Aggregatibacter aphrophilus TaxID=732 RepID=UPI000DAE96BD|nr:hypothetical protein [Aggregatibacter aphrophilus]RDE83435.1 hypothetical protein DPW00_10855 [Aggregatibacter aphrophilus]